MSLPGGPAQSNRAARDAAAPAASNASRVNAPGRRRTIGPELTEPLCQAPWHFLYFLPEPHQHGSLRPMFSLSDLTIWRGPVATAPPPDIAEVATAPPAPPAAAIASAPASDSCSYCKPPGPAPFPSDIASASSA